MTRTLKIVLLGAPGIGKTALALRYFSNVWREHPPPTIGAAFMAKQVDRNGETLHLNLWDTAGTERYRSISPMYVRGADAVLVCYDLSRRFTCEDAGDAVRLVKQQTPQPLLFVVGCKRDLACEPLYAPEDLRMAASDNTVRFISSKQNQGIQELFDAIMEGLQEKDPPDPIPDVVTLLPESPETDRCYPRCGV